MVDKQCDYIPIGSNTILAPWRTLLFFLIDREGVQHFDLGAGATFEAHTSEIGNRGSNSMSSPYCMYG